MGSIAITWREIVHLWAEYGHTAGSLKALMNQHRFRKSVAFPVEWPTAFIRWFLQSLRAPLPP